jgi:superfamily II DNA/RNA helicase
LLHEPTHIDVAPEPDTPAAIAQHAVQVDAARRTQLLRHMIQAGDWTQVLVFVATRYASEHVAGKLCDLGIAAAAFHGELSQGARTRVLADFKAGKLQVMIATDMAARGIHIAELPVVVNYDLPRSAVDYLHRIGRTGRAGATGLAVSFISADTEAHFRLIEKRMGRRIEREQIAGFEPTEPAAPVVSTGGIKGKRKSKKDKLREAAARNV